MSDFFDLNPLPVVDRAVFGGNVNVQLTSSSGQDVSAELVTERRRLEHVFRFVANTPWAITPEILAVITDLITYRMAGYRLSESEVEERIGREPALPYYGESLELRAGGETRGRGGAVALLSLYGVIAPRASMVNSVSGPSGTGLDEFTSMLQSAVDDPEVGSIVIDVNSPGGTVDLVPETGERIRAARKVKPIYAVANTQAGSAAYWLASQATELVATPSAEVGSIGVYAAHQDISGELEQKGRKVTLISAGKYKVEKSPFGELTDEARANVQASVDEYYDMFLDAVGKGRGVKSSVVREGYGEGRMLSARRALSAGMVDRIATLEETVSRALRGGPPSRGRASSFAGVTFPDNAVEAKEDEVALEDLSYLPRI